MAAELEERTVEVNLPTLTADANHRLTVALRDVIGADRVSVPADRPRPSQGDRPHTSQMRRMTTVKAIGLGLVAVVIGVAFVIFTALSHDWLLTGIAFVVLLGSLTVVTMAIIELASVQEYPDPGIVALLAEQGISDPEVRFSEIVMEFTPEVGEHEERHTPVTDDAARALAEQQGALTPTSGPSASGADTTPDSEDA
ncbi:MAG TPA: hypothetical protein VMF07_18300 [Solirubrobacteraceae bacterium]|nr:hypothetical protein [Solirubrobacteraceae bacterium]